jgi:transposase
VDRARPAIAALRDELTAQAKADDAVRRLATIPGVGVLKATALIPPIGDGATFARGHNLAACLGHVPRYRRPGVAGLLRISKRGTNICQILIPEFLSRTIADGDEYVPRSIATSLGTMSSTVIV